MSHTKEPWFFDEDGKIWRRHPKELYQNGGGIAGDKPVAICDKGWYGEGDKGYPNNANARRIVACINACAGLSTDYLEKTGLVSAVGHQLLNADNERDQLRDLCLELLNSMQKINDQNIQIEVCEILKQSMEKARSILGEKNGR